jgi:hypothetical protein
MNSFNYEQIESQYDEKVKEYDSYFQMYIFSLKE